MKVIIEISESQFADIQRIASVQLNGRLPTAEQIIASGTPKPQSSFSQRHENDCISRKEAIEALGEEGLITAMVIVDRLPSVQPEQRWIPFKTRPLTEEEKEDHPEWDCILDCKLPDDGQRILVSVNLRGHEAVQQDEFYSDDGSYFDSGYEIGTEATAWMPLPEPWKEGECK